MRDDFIRDSNPDSQPPEVEKKHRFLFLMSDLAQLRGLTALRNSLVAILPLAVISTILYIAIMIGDLFTRHGLIESITSLSSGSKLYGLEPHSLFSSPYIAPYLVFCALIPVMFSIAFTYHLSLVYKSGDSLPLSLISGVITFIALYSPMFVTGVEHGSMMLFPMNLMESNPGLLSGGIFVGLLVALVNYGLYRLFVGQGITSPLPVNVASALQGGFRVVMPATFTALLVIALVLLVHEPFGEAIYYLTTWMTSGLSSIYAILIIVILVQIFAFFGIQGASSIYSIFWILLFAGSVDPPLWGGSHSDTGFATLSTIFFFVFIGGTGSTLSLNLLMMRARSSQIRKLGNMTLIPSLMNANDILLYGLPLVFNRYLMIPFFLVPLVNLGIAFAAFSFGFMRAPALIVPPYVPAPLGAFLACGGDFRAIVVTCVSILVGMVIYAYFLRMYDFKITELEEIPDPDSRPRRTVI